MNRTNLDVLIQTTVTKLIRSGSSYGRPEFKTVELAANVTCRTGLFFSDRYPLLTRS